MANAADLSLQTFLDALASDSSTPGGGGAAALTGSQAAALVSMVLNFTVGRKKYAAIEEEMQGYLAQSEALRGILLGFIDKDAEAFSAVSACYTMPRNTEAEKAARTQAMQSALKGATEVPFAIAEHCLAVLQLIEPVARQGNTNVVSDAATAAHLAYAGLHSGLVNVTINLKYIQDQAYVATWQEKADILTAHAQSAYQTARAACSATLGVTV